MKSYNVKNLRKVVRATSEQLTLKVMQLSRAEHFGCYFYKKLCCNKFITKLNKRAL